MIIETVAAGAVAVLAAFFAKAGEATAEKIGKSFAQKAGTLVQVIKRKISGDIGAEQSLTLVESKPDSDESQTSLKTVLREKMTEDRNFAALVERLVAEAKEADTDQVIKGSRNIAIAGSARGIFATGDNASIGRS